jgi:ATP-dependent DNA helicase RecG
MIDLGTIKKAPEKIRNGATAASLENEWIDFKRFPLKRGGVSEQKKLSDFLTEYSVSFANTHGGALIFGVENSVAGPSAFTGCSHYDTDEMKKIVYNKTHPSLIIEIKEMPTEETTLLVMFVPKSPVIHSTNKGVKYKRVGKENRTVYPEDEAALKVAKGHDYTASFMLGIEETAIDPIEIARLRNWLVKNNPESDLTSLDDTQLLEAMNLFKEDNGKRKPTLACMLLVGKKDVLADKFPQCETIFLRFEDDDTTPVTTLYLKWPLLKAIDKIWDMIEPYNNIVTIKDAFIETPVPSFPEDVIREGLLNALTHRDYSQNDAVYVKLFKDKIEISSPGGFPGTVTPGNVLTHPPVRRNPLLSEAFQHLGVVNKAGLGVDRMYRRLISYGKMPPEYPYSENVVVLVVRDGNFDETLARFIGRKAKEGHGWKLNELIVIHYLRRNDRITSKIVAKLAQISLKESSELLSSMEESLLERFGTGTGTYYQYNKELFQVLGERTKYTRITGLSEKRMLQFIESHIEQFGKITNNEVQEICGTDRHHSYKLLRTLSSQGKIRKMGSKRGSYYIKAN